MFIYIYIYSHQYNHLLGNAWHILAHKDVQCEGGLDPLSRGQWCLPQKCFPAGLKPPNDSKFMFGNIGQANSSELRPGREFRAFRAFIIRITTVPWNNFRVIVTTHNFAKNNIKFINNIYYTNPQIYAGEWHRWIQIDPNAPVHARIQRGSSDKKMHIAGWLLCAVYLFKRSIVQYFLLFLWLIVCHHSTYPTNYHQLIQLPWSSEPPYPWAA